MAEPRASTLAQRSTGQPGEWRENVGEQPIGPPPAELTPKDYALKELERSPAIAGLTLLEFAGNFTRPELEELCEDYGVATRDRKKILAAASA